MRCVLAPALLGLALAACAMAPDRKLAACPAYQPAFETTDRFMAAFNSKDAAAWGATMHFPHVRIASGRVAVLNSPSELEASFARLGSEDWDHSAWAKRTVVQCEATKAHMLTTFVRYRKDGSVISQFDSLYIVELKNGRWGITARSSFAP